MTSGADARKKAPRPPGHHQTVLRVNGEDQEISFAPHKTLLEVLREDMGLTGTKHGCELGECGVCTVLIDGEPRLSCLTLGLECDGAAIDTIEGMAGPDGPSVLQQEYASRGASQCGYCTSGFLLTARSVLKSDPNPSREKWREELSGNICRCTGYLQIFEAVEAAAARLRGEEAVDAE